MSVESTGSYLAMLPSLFSVARSDWLVQTAGCAGNAEPPHWNVIPSAPG
jgi:hypothetical protein